MDNFITRTAVGMVVSYVLLSLVLAVTPQVIMSQETIRNWGFFNLNSVGSLLNNLFVAAIFLLFYLVCTGGLGLVIWIPFSYGLGWIVFRLLGWDQSKTTAPAKEINRQEAAMSQRDSTALLAYIAKAREKGLSDDQIWLKLENNGWSLANINWAFKALNQQSNL